MLLFIKCVSADGLRYENDITLGEICNTLRGVPALDLWGWGEYVAEGF